MGDYIVYKHTSPSGKAYVGLTCQSLERRGRKGLAYQQCPAFYAAIQKYGWDNFTHETLESGLSFEEACDKERFYIDFFHTLINENGYNLITGGLVGRSVSEETKRKISRTLSGRKGTPHTEASKAKLRAARLGKKGVPRTLEQRKRVSEALKGRAFSDEHRRHISESKQGVYVGKNNPRARKVLCVETGVVFDTIKEAGRFKGGSETNIVSCCTGRLKTSGGYHWRYVE